MMMTAIVTIWTAKASGYLQQLCKHFGHQIKVEFTPETGSLKFDFGHADLEASAETLTMRAMADKEEDLARLKRVLASHLERLAFRENLEINWDN